MVQSWISKLVLAITASNVFTSALAQEIASLPTVPVESVTTPSVIGLTDTATSTPVSPKSAKAHLIKVGAGEFKFQPQQLANVAVGDSITFEFYPPDHSVARAEFGSACVPYESTGKGKQGFWSGTQYIDSVDELEQYNVTINSTEPIFFYCAAPQSCTSELMVGVINPNSTQTLEKQIEAAKSAKFQYAPGQPMPSEGSETPNVELQSSQSKEPSKISTTVIVGIALGIIAFLGMCAALFFFIGRHKSLKEAVKRQGEGALIKPIGVGGGYTELGFRQSTFSHAPSTPHGGYPQKFGTPLPAYKSLSMGRAGQHNSNLQDQKVSQSVVLELHSPTLGRQGFVAELEAPCIPTQQKKQ